MTMWAAEARLRRNAWIWKGLISQKGSEGRKLRNVWSSFSVQLTPEIRVKWGQIPLRKTRTKQPHWVMTSVLFQEVGEPFVISSCKVPERGAITGIGYTQLQHLQAFGTRGLSPPKNQMEMLVNQCYHWWGEGPGIWLDTAGAARGYLPRKLGLSCLKSPKRGKCRVGWNGFTIHGTN